MPVFTSDGHRKHDIKILWRCSEAEAFALLWDGRVDSLMHHLKLVEIIDGAVQTLTPSVIKHWKGGETKTGVQCGGNSVDTDVMEAKNKHGCQKLVRDLITILRSIIHFLCTVAFNRSCNCYLVMRLFVAALSLPFFSTWMVSHQIGSSGEQFSPCAISELEEQAGNASVVEVTAAPMGWKHKSMENTWLCRNAFLLNEISCHLTPTGKLRILLITNIC